MSLQSLIRTGTKVWLDSVDPGPVLVNRSWGATGATSNPIIVSEILKAGPYDERILELIEKGHSDEQIAWEMTDRLVSNAQTVFRPVWEQTQGNDGYVSFELDPLIEDAQRNLSLNERVQRYILLGQKWGTGQGNRMIKVPGTDAGLAALEELAAAGVPLNVTLLFTERQYVMARDAVWRGAQRCRNRDLFKSVYSIFVSRLDVYTEKQVPQLSAAAQGLVGIVNAKRLWRLNRDFWQDKNLTLQQEMIFASTGTKKAGDAPDKYVEALAGSDIQTNPPATNAAVQEMNKTYTCQVDVMPPNEVLEEIDRLVDVPKMEQVLMREGVDKFALPQKALLKLIGEKRASLTAAR